MLQYTYKDIEKFLLDDNLFQWAKYGDSDTSFDLESYKLQHPGCGEQIDLAIAIIRGVKVTEDAKHTSPSYKMYQLNAMLDKVSEERPIKSVTQTSKHYFSLRRRLIAPIASAVALLILFYGAYWMTNSLSVSNSQGLTATVTDTICHSNQVQIILDGKQAVGLDQNNAEITVEEDGSILVDKQLVTKAREEKVATNQVIVPYGKRSKIFLPDGSILWINSGSSISYTSDFQINRKLNVQGEVYLDVKKDAAHPFVVKTNRMEVTVLGTSFNVTDYARDEESAVVLVQGSVNVTLKNNLKQRLSPNQRFTNENGVLKVDEVDVYSYICWKDNIMKFNGQKLGEILQLLSRYYDVKIEINGSLKDEQYFGTLDLNCTIDDILENISLTTPLQITKEGNVMYIKQEK